MHIFDTHCHLSDTVFSTDMNALVDRAAAAGVRDIMLVGICLDDSRKTLALAETRPEFHAAVGIHPHDAASCSKDALRELAELSRHPKVRAWGEIGLDFNRMRSPRPVQEKWFAAQLEAAGDAGLPVIFHERDSGGRFLDMLRVLGPPPAGGVVHCFSGSREEMTAYLDLGLMIGITGILTIRGRGAGLRELAADAPLDRMVVETDAPYLTPAPARNKFRRNEPAFVRHTLHRLAEVRGMDAKDLAPVIYANSRRLYRLPAPPEKAEGMK